jgi:Fis family transcriptional regulator
MNAERAAATEPVSKRRVRKSVPPSGTPVPLRIAERPARERIQRLVKMALSLLSEAQTLACDKAFTDESIRLRALDPAQGIDLYSEVERFETGLIKLALEHTGGNQAKAAKLLHLKPTTLNSKIKQYSIEY